jgi:hypothetical protein
MASATSNLRGTALLCGWLTIGCLVSTGCGRTDLVRDAAAPVEVGETEVVETCRPGLLPAKPSAARVFFLVDRSASMSFDMQGNFGGLFGPPLQGPPRWLVLRNTLAAALPSFEQRLAVGVAFFPSDDTCGGQVTLAVEPRERNSAEVLRAFSRSPSGGTPTTDALTSGAALARAQAAPVMVLITDGEPNCSAAEDPATCACTAPRLGIPPTCGSAENCSDATRAIGVMGTLRQRFGVVTAVVGLGADTGSREAVLESLATAGGAPRVGADKAFFSGASEAELSAALQRITSQVANCAWQAPLGEVRDVRVGARVVPRSDWAWQDEAARVFLLGAAWCDRAAQGEPVSVEVACPPP